ncbi:hypothetical protein X771_02250 [Mesorhizobium sp. LSJC277A00]|nr:hypothetical protein X771_02250 [Mesorhizobium sp. LSJC277A00]
MNAMHDQLLAFSKHLDFATPSANDALARLTLGSSKYQRKAG